MRLARIVELTGEIFQVDLEERGKPGWSAGYFIKGGTDWMLIETGPASSAERILEAARSIGLDRSQVKHVGVTHVHVDHAGGLGLIARHFAGAEIWVHPVGGRHMVNPARLIEGSMAVYGERKMREYGEVLPVPEERLRPAIEGKIINLRGRPVEVWETPGHARHSVCFYDARTKGLFSGDAIGVYLPQLSAALRYPVIRPATPVPDFNGELMMKDLYRFAHPGLQHIYFTHFGAASPAQLLIELAAGQLSFHLRIAEDCLDEEGADEENALAKLTAALREYSAKVLRRDMEKINVSEEMVSPEMSLLLDPLDDSAAGLLAYVQKAPVKQN